jgi:phosphatidate cytidylyltransferase
MTDVQVQEGEVASEPAVPATTPAEERPVSVPVRTAIGLGAACVLVALLAADSLWPQGFLFAAVGALVVAVALREYAGLFTRLGTAVPARFLMLAGCAAFLVQWAGLAAPLHFPSPWLGAMLVVVLAVAGILSRRALQAQVDGSLAEASAVALGLVYVPLFFGFLVAIRIHWGLPEAILLLAVCKGSSSAAYFAGKSLGRHKMTPVVSPKKTYEGLAGSFVAGLAVPWVAAAAGWVVLTVWQAVAFGFVVWAAATVGDLVASLLKREAAVKDSGQMLPGVGGMLDMLDDVLFAAPFGYLVLAACGAQA